MEKKFFAVIIGSCILSVVLGVGFGYLLFGGATVNARIYTDTPVQAAVPAVSGKINEVVSYLAESEALLPAHRYVVTVVDGYIAVFYAEGAGGGLLEITTTPYHSLPTADREKLQRGIPVYTEEALGRILQDYGS
ncbi:MAG: hypothetical protein FWB88_12680 [Defluviitaleaceae bacterium]|nr:hypothetical protein [Defluviitaleaceae bacterium]MCL2240489.1 hypothetical protein [Defluviitaleaceae bacterium]